jgi:hypothetical protein
MLTIEVLAGREGKNLRPLGSVLMNTSTMAYIGAWSLAEVLSPRTVKSPGGPEWNSAKFVHVLTWYLEDKLKGPAESATKRPVSLDACSSINLPTMLMSRSHRAPEDK